MGRIVRHRGRYYEEPYRHKGSVENGAALFEVQLAHDKKQAQFDRDRLRFSFLRMAVGLAALVGLVMLLRWVFR
jgi:hypothetical protein